jgi:phage-related protein
MDEDEKVLVWLNSEVKTPPFSETARIEAGHYLRMLQQRQLLSMPHSRPMASVGAGCHELRINDAEVNIQWRLMYYIDADAIVILDVFQKRTQTTPQAVLDTCRQRLARYLRDIE